MTFVNIQPWKYNHLMVSVRAQSRTLLSSKNASITNPRLLVLELLLKKECPLTIDQILKLSRGKIALSSLYRVINDLREFGLITEFNTPENTIVIELNRGEEEHHHHIFCEKCGSITDIELSLQLEQNLDKEVSKIERTHSITIRDHSLELFGLCNSCQAQ